MSREPRTDSHLRQRVGNLGPDSVNVVVERLERKDLELRLLLLQKGEYADS